MPNTRFINPPTIAKPPGYTHVVEITGPARIVYVAGQLGLDTGGKMADGFQAQTEQAFRNLKAALDAVGAKPEHIVKINNYRSEEHTSELQSLRHLVCRLLLEKKKSR